VLDVTLTSLAKYDCISFCCIPAVQIKEDAMGRTSSTHGEMRNPCKILVGQLERKGSLGRRRRRWESNIKNHCKEIGPGLDSAANTIMNLWVP
jgi:hypothetical protein